MQRTSSRGPAALGLLALGVLTFATFSSCLRNGILNWDDVFLLRTNAGVVNFDWGVLLWQPALGIWHPLTLLSLAVEYRLFGPDPFVFHLDNVLLHVANTLLVALLLRRLLPDGGFAPLLAAALFAVHPLHVESVAWIAERKDLLATFFYLLTLLAWLRYCARPRARQYAVSLALFALALLSKPMAVSAPLVMLATDHHLGRRRAGRLLLEKLPFAALAVGAGLVNLATQAPDRSEEFAIFQLDALGRLWLGFQSLVFYVSKAVLPVRLSAYYDVGLVRIALHQYVLALAALAALAAAALRGGGRGNAARWGVLFFLLAIAPVLKVVPFGGDSLFNDRYMYLPSVGLCLAAALPFRRLNRWPPPRRLLAAAAWGVAIAVLAVQSHERGRVWRDSDSFWSDVLEKYPGTALALTHLARHLLDEGGDLERARALLEEALRVRPGFAPAHFNLGLLHEQRDEREAAREQFARAIAARPRDASYQLSVGAFHERAGDLERAIEHYRRATEIEPAFAIAHHNLGLAYVRLGRIADATEAFERAIAARPKLGPSYLPLAELYWRQQRREEARALVERAVELGESVDPALLRQLGIGEPSERATGGR